MQKIKAFGHAENQEWSRRLAVIARQTDEMPNGRTKTEVSLRSVSKVEMCVLLSCQFIPRISYTRF